MRTTIKVSCLFASVLLIATLVIAAPLGSGFTYQGQINIGSLPINGEVNLRFSLWDEVGVGVPPTGGTQIGSSQNVVEVPVANGVFVVRLNAFGEFGATAFNGEERWLQIEVCDTNQCDTTTILSPRQLLTGAPYALGPWNTTANGDIVFTGPGKVGIGTASPGKRLTVAGDSELGTGHGDYVHMRIGGGNSSGFLYGSFPRYADGIHWGYNYYADKNGADVIIQPDGATSRITTGYGFISLATGGVNQPPTERMVVESNGNVRIGSSAQFQVPAGDEALRIVRGVISSDGGILAGGGFQVSRPQTGTYDITFNTPFPSAPTVTATAESPTLNASYVAMTDGVTGSGARIVVFLSGSDAEVNLPFHFIAIGPR